MIFGWIIFFAAMLITIFVHETAHLIAALLCGVKVEAFAIGFGKPLFHKKIKGIDFRFCPILLGGYTKLVGEYDKTPNGFLAQKYWKKVCIVAIGGIVNILLAFLCYWLNYRSVSLGMWIDWQLVRSLFIKDYSIMDSIFLTYQLNPILLQFSLINVFCGIFNLLPLPAVDGSLIWLLLLEKKIKDFPTFLKKCSYYGFIIIMFAQLILLWYIYS